MKCKDCANGYHLWDNRRVFEGVPAYCRCCGYRGYGQPPLTPEQAKKLYELGKLA